jgi:hypothetical protein
VYAVPVVRLKTTGSTGCSIRNMPSVYLGAKPKSRIEARKRICRSDLSPFGIFATARLILRALEVAPRGVVVGQLSADLENLARLAVALADPVCAYLLRGARRRGANGVTLFSDGGETLNILEVDDW